MEITESPLPVDSGAARRNKRNFILLALIFILPAGIAYGLYFSGWRPAKTINHGELVSPPRPLEDVALKTLSGADFNTADLRRRWTFVYFGAPDCPRVCADNLYKMRQVHIAQGKNQDRVQRLFVLTGNDTTGRLRKRLQDHPELKVVTGPEAGVRALAKQFVLPAGSPLDLRSRIYLVDPLGNLMMSYPADADPSGMRKDLARLLRVSQVG